jgi:hypothetical protein
VSTCKRNEDVALVGLGFADSRNVYLDFDQPSEKNKLIRRVTFGAPREPTENLENFSKGHELKAAKVTATGSTDCGVGSVFVLKKGATEIEKETPKARFVVTEFHPFVRGKCDKPKRIAFAVEVEDFSLEDGLKYLKAMKKAQQQPTKAAKTRATKPARKP